MLWRAQIGKILFNAYYAHILCVLPVCVFGNAYSRRISAALTMNATVGGAGPAGSHAIIKRCGSAHDRHRQTLPTSMAVCEEHRYFRGCNLSAFLIFDADREKDEIFTELAYFAGCREFL